MTSRDTYAVWREPRIGKANPDPMTNRFWRHLFKKRMGGLEATLHFEGDSDINSPPACDVHGL